MVTNEISKVRFRDELWIDSGEISLEIELISHQKETKVDIQMNFGNFICTYNFRYHSKDFIVKYMFALKIFYILFF